MKKTALLLPIALLLVLPPGMPIFAADKQESELEKVQKIYQAQMEKRFSPEMIERNRMDLLPLGWGCIH